MMDELPIIRASECDCSFLSRLPQHKLGKGHKPKGNRYFVDCISAFDIETTRYDIGDTPHAFMYIWQWHFSGECTVIGRTWEEFTEFYSRVSAALCDRWLVVYVHKLSFEFQFLAGVLPMGDAEIFATDLRKPLFFRLNQLEWRCSYRLSNCSLASWTKDLDVEHKKLSGEEFNYTKVRYPWTELTAQELAYCVNDVIGVVECVEKTLARFGDTLYSIPYTSTGYIRRMVKRGLRASRSDIANQQNCLAIYDALRLAYRGGDTHANRFEAGAILRDVYSYDRSSSYPDVMIHCKFPVSRFRAETIKTLDRCMEIVKAGRCYLTKVLFKGARVKPWNTCPYLSLSKCWGEGLLRPMVYQLDNGRILSADAFEMWVTDVDMEMILKEYDFEGIAIEELYSARYGYLPQSVRDIIITLYKDKTELKGIEGAEERYMMSKHLLNSVYGMMCQRVITPAVVLNGNTWEYDINYNREDEYNETIKKAFLNYAWGVWVCAWARKRLHEGIDAAGWDNFVYCDTDSVKSMVDLNIGEFNATCIKNATKSGAMAYDKRGNAHYMGVFEKEEKYDAFVTLGAKRYAYEIDGKIGLTVAGVKKGAGAAELARKGGLTAFQPGIVFEDAGHIAAYFNDDVNMCVEVDGKSLHIVRNVCLVETPYTLKMSNDPRDALHNLKLAIDRFNEKDYNTDAFRE